MSRKHLPTRRALPLAQNPTTTGEELATLVAHPRVDVRLAVARHPNLSEETGDLLAVDPVWAIAEAIRERRGEVPAPPAQPPEVAVVAFGGMPPWWCIATAVAVGAVIVWLILIIAGVGGLSLLVAR